MNGVRFAPSPTGKFHLGNLRTAWISREWAKTLKAPWVVRFEDIDAPRVLPGAKEAQLADMKALGLLPDLVLDQSSSHARHRALFEQAKRAGKIYPCTCSRKEVQLAASAPHGGHAVYSGKCRQGIAVEGHAGAFGWRFKMDDERGAQDFIVARQDGDLISWSYHWACAIDDWDGAYELLVRASDLRSVVPTQRAIQAWIASSEEKAVLYPSVFHASLVVQDDGHRLEKRTRGVTLQELFERGISATDLLRRFEASFDRGLLNPALSPARVFGEAEETLTLSRLGLAS